MSRSFGLTYCILVSAYVSVSANSNALSGGDKTTAIERRLDEIERQGRDQRDDLAALRDQNAKLHEENAQLRKANAQIVQRVRILEDIQRMTIDQLSKGQNVEKDLNEKRASSKYTQKEKWGGSSINPTKEGSDFVAKEEQELVPANIGHNRIRQLGEGSTVAFFASRGGAHATHLGQHQAVVFDKIITNIGNGYHNSTGTFIAPASGVYVFSTTILAFREYAHFNYAVNGRPQTLLFAHSSDTYETASQTAIFHLSKGDDVVIQSSDSDKFVHGDGYSTFSGFLLVPIEGDSIIG